MASRSRKRRSPPPAAALEGSSPKRPYGGRNDEDPLTSRDLSPEELAALELDPMARRYARSRAKDEAVRRGLEPLAPGERPGVVTVAAIIAFAFAFANVIATFAVKGLTTSQGNPTTVSYLTMAILVLAGVGMLARQYWAVLLFECILGLQIVVLSLAFTRVQKWWLAICMVIAIGLLGYLFWKLIRAMARLQMPPPPGPAQPKR